MSFAEKPAPYDAPFEEEDPEPASKAALMSRMFVKLAADPTANADDAMRIALQAVKLIAKHDLTIMTRRALQIARGERR